ncbi:hypothetical protein [Streptomyces scabiei]|uniref:hypothetical protein n=1 Tax=Streptomyces scabiei TaxID=1930 RepID=UPI0029AD2CB8|nr:hypothetical protein [Streptomyces scabiei]MDX2794012.1 hypothetical protein [Streptomyces scabiei]
MNFLNDLTLRAYVALQTFAATEPVRLRAALTSLVLAAAFVFPVLSAPGLAEKIGALGVVALPILVGESTRSRVSPA